MSTEDWRSACILLANAYLGFIDIALESAPNDEKLKQLANDQTGRLVSIITTGTLENAKK